MENMNEIREKAEGLQAAAEYLKRAYTEIDKIIEQSPAVQELKKKVADLERQLQEQPTVNNPLSITNKAD